MRRFIIAVANHSQEKVAGLTNRLTEIGFEWWAWIPGFWLLAKDLGADALPPAIILQLRDEAAKFFSGTVFVAEVDPIAFGGRADDAGVSQQLEWLNRWWVNPGAKMVAPDTAVRPGTS